MDIKDFKAGTWKTQVDYKTFSPTLVNKEWIISDPILNTLLSRANRLLGELNAFSMYVPDVNFFIFMHVVKEATTSSRIEGTQTRIEEALYSEEEIIPERRDDWHEVQNYIKAMDDAIKRLEEIPLSLRLLKQAHSQLLFGVRGKHKHPGEFRASQNWIGGATIQDAVFVPPVHTDVLHLMDDLEKFLHNEQHHVPELVKIAIAHYQFETIHPFLDGNGRLGRLLITLYLVSQKVMTRPTLYLSAFFEKNRLLYYDNLHAVHFNNNMEQWLRFFLVGVIETATKAIDTFQQILQIKTDIESRKLVTLGRKAPNALLLLNELWKNPVTSATKTSKLLQLSTPTANSLLKEFQSLGILKEQTGYKRNRIFIFQQYLDLFLG